MSHSKLTYLRVYPRRGWRGNSLLGSLRLKGVLLHPLRLNITTSSYVTLRLIQLYATAFQSGDYIILFLSRSFRPTLEANGVTKLTEIN